MSNALTAFYVGNKIMTMTVLNKKKNWISQMIFQQSIES